MLLELKDLTRISVILCVYVLFMNNNTSHPSVPAKPEIQTAMSTQHKTDDVNEPNLLQGPPRAKPIPGRDPALQMLVDIVMALSPRYSSLKSALKQYLLSDRSLDEIASEHSYTGPALIYWIKKLGLPRRRQKRGVLFVPMADQQNLPRSERCFPRSVVISFRLTAEQWQLLLAAKPASGEFNLSGFKKARAIVLSHISPPRGKGPELTKASPSLAPAPANVAVIGVHNEKAA